MEKDKEKLKHYDVNYRVASYNIDKSNLELINKYFSEKYSVNVIEVKDFKDSFTDENLMKQADIILVNEDDEIPDFVEDISISKHAQIMRVTTIPLKESLYEKDDNVICLSNEKCYKKNRITGELIETDYYSASMEWLVANAQLANTSKLRTLVEKKYIDERQKRNPGNDNKNKLESLIRLKSFIKGKDDYTKMHSDDVSKYAIGIAKELNLPNEEINRIRVGGEMHDIGKVIIPEEIIRKKDKLTSGEWEIMQTHTVRGAELLRNIADNDIIEMIEYHHERYDGKGYPKGLKGEDIPLYARILAVADTFDAMTTDRGYNNPKNLVEGLIELQKSSVLAPNRYGEMSQQLDPNMVNAFISAVLKNKINMGEMNLEIQEIQNAIIETGIVDNIDEINKDIIGNINIESIITSEKTSEGGKLHG